MLEEAAAATAEVQASSFGVAGSFCGASELGPH